MNQKGVPKAVAKGLRRKMDDYFFDRRRFEIESRCKFLEVPEGFVSFTFIIIGYYVHI